MKSLKPSQLKLLPALLGMLFTGSAMSAGFQLQNQNGAGTGLAYAGQAANPEDASTVFFNPAGMSYLPAGQNISVAGTIIQRSVKFSDAGTAALLAYPVGDNGGDGGGSSLIPAFFYTRTINPQVTFGLGVSPTYGSETEYGSNFVGRFSGLYASIKQININPSVSYKVDEALTVGFGLNYAKNQVEFRQMVPIGASGALATIKGDDSATGWNAGLMYKVDAKTRLGVSYRSKINFHLTGTQQIPAASINAAVTADLATPDNLSFAMSHKANDKLEWLGDITRTGWSSIQVLQVVGGTNPSLPYNFKNAWRVGLGAKYQYDGKWNLRAGVAFDKTPVPDSASRTMTLPDSDRTWLSVGARMKLNERSSLDFGYAHIFLKDSSTSRQVKNGATVIQTVRGDFKTSVNLFSAQYNVNF
jgi:long-chain fatty acid transport protein